MLTVVPALTVSCAPSATTTSPTRFNVPLQVSLPEIVPDLVSLIAEAVGSAISPVIVDSNKSTTNDRLF